MTRYDVIVVGGGHAGTEAALAAARMKSKTLLITQNIETLGQMSCNPAIGGIGKSHLVKEIDALGGVMAEAADAAGIHFRVLNGRKGPAVRATRAQADRQLYKAFVRQKLEHQENLSLFQQSVADLIIENNRVVGVITQMQQQFRADAVILTVGTFLGGVIHVGLNQQSGGRAGDAASNKLSERLRELPFQVGRLKTGTPPRIDGRSVDFILLTEQPGDTPRPVMSFWSKTSVHPEQRPCYITHTNEATHDLIRAGLERSPLYSGVIDGVGPRYCPSIEDKVQRFADKTAHQIFVEPEGLNTTELYPNGISTSLPFDVQVNLIRSIKGFENAHISRPGYAIEYDFFEPKGLKSTLETKPIQGLYFAGQINGTTGYEEAAAQGLLAGINAALQSQSRAPWSPGREQAYLGVLVDDLITLGTLEPYRMFTSRAEYRLILRQDNADRRLTETGRKLGLVDDGKWNKYLKKQDRIEKLAIEMADTVVFPGNPAINALLEEPLVREYHLSDLLKRPGVDIQSLLSASGKSDDDVIAAEQVEIDIKYQGYIARQQQDIDRTRAQYSLNIPIDMDYACIHGLSNEVKQKLQDVKPENLGQASRISGVTPAAVSLLLVHLKRRRDLQQPAATG